VAGLIKTQLGIVFVYAVCELFVFNLATTIVFLPSSPFKLHWSRVIMFM